MCVEAADAVHAVLSRQRKDVERVERPQPGEVEDRPEIDEERIVDLAREDLPAVTREVLHGRRHQRGVRRRRARADVHRRGRQVLAEVRPTVSVSPDQAVELGSIPVRVGNRVDRAGVVEERVPVPRLRAEAELVDDVLLAVGRVVDVDLVDDVLAEGIEVRPAGRLFERDVVRHDRDRVRLIRTTECVDVRVVRGRVLADQWCLAVARCAGILRAGAVGEHECERENSGSHRHESDERSAFPWNCNCHLIPP